jgi:hypothetical protein
MGAVVRGAQRSTGRVLASAPCPGRRHGSGSRAPPAVSPRSLVDTASVNMLKLRLAADFISSRTMDAARPVWERLWSGDQERAD